VLEDVILISVCCFFGRILSQKCGLWKPFVFCKKPLVKTLLYILVFGILFSLDYWTFGAWIPGIQAADKVMLTPDAILAGLIYGGICEEILLRLFFMSLLAFMIWKLFFKKTEAKNVPASVFMIANVISALIFAAGHLPATIAAFGALTPLLVIRCFLLNGGFGLLFGYLYRKKGLIYAMLAHAGVHLVSVLIWTIFI
jgi:membrane protease YdiL (CAAX protease family)